MTKPAQPSRILFKPILSGSWQEHAALRDYRAEWLSSLLVERATWTDFAPTIELADAVIGGPEFVWFRFWLPEPDQLVEKYFDADGTPIGVYIPICEPLLRENKSYRTSELILAVWVDNSKRVSVLREFEFDEAVRRQIISPEEAERAEARIRELTAAIFREEFPPALVRNFAIASDETPAAESAPASANDSRSARQENTNHR